MREELDDLQVAGLPLFLLQLLFYLGIYDPNPPI
jgi:hypothetical protein